MNTSTKELDEKTDAMQDLESLNCVLTVKECITNQELQESCKELMEVCLYPLIIIHAVERKIASSKYACSTKSVWLSKLRQHIPIISLMIIHSFNLVTLYFKHSIFVNLESRWISCNPKDTYKIWKFLTCTNFLFQKFHNLKVIDCAPPFVDLKPNWWGLCVIQRPALFHLWASVKSWSWLFAFDLILIIRELFSLFSVCGVFFFNKKKKKVFWQNSKDIIEYPIQIQSYMSQSFAVRRLLLQWLAQNWGDTAEWTAVAWQDIV